MKTFVQAFSCSCPIEHTIHLSIAKKTLPVKGEFSLQIYDGKQRFIGMLASLKRMEAYDPEYARQVHFGATRDILLL